MYYKTKLLKQSSMRNPKLLCSLQWCQEREDISFLHNCANRTGLSVHLYKD